MASGHTLPEHTDYEVSYSINIFYSDITLIVTETHLQRLLQCHSGRHSPDGSFPSIPFFPLGFGMDWVLTHPF
jgi:hypothetical protein